MAATSLGTAQTLEPAPKPVDLHLAGDHLYKAAELRQYALVVSLVGLTFTAIAIDSPDSKGLPLIFGGTTVAITYGLSMFAIGHERKASKILREL